MKYKKIGDTKVPAIGQGTGGVYNPNIIKVGIEHGLTLIDTAESYGNEEVVGEAIKGQRDKVFISTKFSPEHNGYEGMIQACEGSLKRLGTDYIDLYSMHHPNPNVSVEETVSAFDKLLNDGKIRYAGLCNVYTPFMANMEANAVQIEYNLFDRSAEKTLLPYCAENSIAMLAYSPIRDYHSLNPDGMAELQEFGMSYPDYNLAQFILNWAISHSPVIALTSSNDVKHIKRNAHASDFNLSKKDIKKIDKLFKPDITNMPLERIDITLSADKYPQTKEEAMSWGSWAVKPQDVNLNEFKPVKVRIAAYGNYELIEGGLRYWAWVIQKNEPIPAIIKRSVEQWFRDFKG